MAQEAGVRCVWGAGGGPRTLIYSLWILNRDDNLDLQAASEVRVGDSLVGLNS